VCDLAGVGGGVLAGVVSMAGEALGIRIAASTG
jgi:hypothetical protein